MLIRMRGIKGSGTRFTFKKVGKRDVLVRDEKLRDWEKTPKGLLTRKYAAIKWRCSGRSGRANYAGLPYPASAAFYEWALADPLFWELHRSWKVSGFKRALSPTVDRIDNKLGYIFENMRWITYAENTRKGSLHEHRVTGVSPFRGVCRGHSKTKPWRAKIYKNRKGYDLGSFETEEAAALAYNRMSKTLYGDEAPLNEIPQAT